MAVNLCDWALMMIRESAIKRRLKKTFQQLRPRAAVARPHAKTHQCPAAGIVSLMPRHSLGIKGHHILQGRKFKKRFSFFLFLKNKRVADLFYFKLELIPLVGHLKR
jgi:hypothetical protein